MNENSKYYIMVIMGSVRSGRNCPVIAQWVSKIGQENTDFNIEVIDLLDWSLPMDDEPNLPMRGEYKQPHSRAWSAKVAQADGFVFVSPQYNWGYPAVLKNAIDHCYNEWTGKPLLIFTYGGHGGGKCAAQLRQVAEGLKMQPVLPMPALTLSNDMIQGAASIRGVDFQEALEVTREGWKALSKTLTGENKL